MARAIWTGVISFGLVSVPVGLFSATEDHDQSFHQFEEGTTDRIRYKRVNEATDEEVEYSQIVKGADVGGGHYVMLETDELASVAPGRSRSLEIDTFVDLDEIDPIFFAKSYYLGPRDKDTVKAYALLRDAMAAENKAAVARFVMRGREYLTAIRADEKVLVLSTLHFADEIRDPSVELDDLPAKTGSGANDLKMARQLITTMAGPWRPKDYHDSYAERVQELIKAKGKGEEYETADEAPDATNVVDLVSVLRASVEAAKGRKAPAKKSTAKKSTAKKTARKSTAKKSAAKTTPAKKTPARKTAKKAS